MWYKWIFEDGYFEICKGYDKVEMQHMVAKHGKLIRKERV